MQYPARPRVPDCELPLHAGCGNLPVVRAEGHTDDRLRVLDGQRLVVALPLQEAPPPAAQMVRALVEPLLRMANVAGGQLAPRQGGSLQVRGLLLAFEGLLDLGVTHA